MLKKSLLFFTLLLPLHAWADDCPAVSKKMGVTIEAQILKERGVESCKYRYVYKEMGVELVLFTITGACVENPEQAAGSCGDKNTVYVAGVIHGKIYAPVAASNVSGFTPIKVKKVDEAIVLTGLTYSKSDPLCCPSVQQNHSLRITESGFQE